MNKYAGSLIKIFDFDIKSQKLGLFGLKCLFDLTIGTKTKQIMNF